MENDEVRHDLRLSDLSLNSWVDDRMATLQPDGEWAPNKARARAKLRERTARSESRRTKRTWSILVAVAVCAPLMAIPSTREFAHRCVSACVSESVWVAQLVGLKAAPRVAYVKLEQRRIAPDFTLNDASGRPVKLSDLRGNVVLLNFWATWCGPCKVEIPWFQEFQTAYRAQGFAVVGVSLDEDGWKAVSPYLEQRGVSYRIVVDNNNVAQLYGGLESLPTTMIIDRSGRIAAYHVGICSRDEYERDILAALNDRN